MMNQDSIVLHGKKFRKYISANRIEEIVGEIAEEVNASYSNQSKVLVIPVLNGAFVFAADLIRKLKMDFELAFVKTSSYQGENSSGRVKVDLNLPARMEDHHVLLLEDIIDTGRTVEHILKLAAKSKPASFKTCSLLYKPHSSLTAIAPDYYGLEVGEAFVVGYGLDYDGLGRGLPDLYIIDKK